MQVNFHLGGEPQTTDQGGSHFRQGSNDCFEALRWPAEPLCDRGGWGYRGSARPPPWSVVSGAPLAVSARAVSARGLAVLLLKLLLRINHRKSRPRHARSYLVELRHRKYTQGYAFGAFMWA
jgi:hypothetical protein